MEAKASRTSKVKSKKKIAPTPTFDAQAFLDSAGAARKVSEFQRKKIIFSQGDDAKYVMYIQKGSVKLSIVNEVGREAVVAILDRVTFLARDASQVSPFVSGRQPRLHRRLYSLLKNKR